MRDQWEHMVLQNVQAYAVARKMELLNDQGWEQWGLVSCNPSGSVVTIFLRRQK